MDALLKKAEDLGRLLAGHERFKRLIAARDAVRADKTATELLRGYESQIQKIEDLTVKNKPIEVADKRALAEMEQKLASNDTVKAMAKAQADFSEMMNHVNRAIYEKIAPANEAQDETADGKS